jgi:hypothetical protein
MTVALRFGAKLWAPLDSPGAANGRHIWLADLPTQHAVRRDFGRPCGLLQCTSVLIAELQPGCIKQPLKLVERARPDDRRGDPSSGKEASPKRSPRPPCKRVSTPAQQNVQPANIGAAG